MGVKGPAVKSLNVSICRDQHDAWFEEFLSRGKERLRIRIRSNSYKFQSSAVLEIFDPAARAWNHLVSIEHPMMQTREGLCYGRTEPCGGDFYDDRNALIDKALLVLA